MCSLTAASAAPWNFLELQILGPHFRPAESETAGEASCSWCIFKREKHWPAYMAISFIVGERMTSRTTGKQENSLWIISPKWYRENSSLRGKKIKWSSKNWQCMVVWKPHETNEQRLKSGASQGTSSCWASVHIADCDPWTKIQKDKSEGRKSLCLSFVRASYCLAFLVTIHLFPSCQHADNQHQSTLIPDSFCFSFLCFSF